MLLAPKNKKISKKLLLALLFPEAIYFCPENDVYFTSAAYIKVPFGLDVFMKANNMNPDQTAPFVHVF